MRYSIAWIRIVPLVSYAESWLELWKQSWPEEARGAALDIPRAGLHGQTPSQFAVRQHNITTTEERAREIA